MVCMAFFRSLSPDIDLYFSPIYKPGSSGTDRMLGQTFKSLWYGRERLKVARRLRSMHGAGPRGCPLFDCVQSGNVFAYNWVQFSVCF